ncbi:MAG: hypothetical protein A3F72_02180 [Bacteroidetes bacterium RIFCSPLOWO2_12_FULL_35_15]|nr:MAG: hypothetical protein A3F72_02180 [Bacteroidetes bacterium RIFCSPLOWO2_12_FULL_35_15]
MKFLKQILFLLFLSFFQINLSVAQQYNFKNFSTKNGLANSTVNNIFQDSKGYMWFATQGGGVSKFNGKTFKNYSKDDGLIANEVTCVEEDKHGNIWIATSAGISKFDGLNFINFSEKEGLHVNDGIYWLHVDSKNVLWIAIRGGGVARLDLNKAKGTNPDFTYLTTNEGLSSNLVFSISEDKKGNLWFSLENGIAKYDGKKITTIDNIDFINKKIFFCSYTDSRGNVWFGSIGDGLVRYNGTSFQKIILPESVQNDFLGSIAEDKKGNLWLATLHGMLKIEGNKFHLFTEKEGLSSNGVNSISVDYEDNIWAGTQGGGVNLFNNESFVNYNDKDGLTSKSISDIYQYDNENYIIGTTGQGLNFFNSKTNQFYVSPDLKKIDQSVVYTILSDNEKNIWIGTQEGIFVLQKVKDNYKIIKEYTSFDSTKLVAVLKIIQDKKNNIWIASYGSGIFKINNGKVTTFNKKNGFVTDNIMSVFEDSKSNIWIGTKDAGVVKYDGTNFVNYTEKDGLSDKTIWSISEDKNGNMFFGTGESGLSCFDGKTFKSISIKDGLCSNYIPALLFDEHNNSIWVGTDKGVNKLKLKQNFEIESLRYYGEQEGYKGNEINQNAISQDSEGTVWFGTQNGLCRYYRKYDVPNRTSPKLHLNSIRMAYQTVDWKNFSDSIDPMTNLPVDLILSHKNNNLTFDFQAFTTDNVKYTFILEGQDEDWSPLSTNTEAAYTNIDPGRSYTFKVKAVNSNSVWSNDVVNFSFTIKPPWWKTWWFYTLSILIVVVSVFGYINYQTAQLAKDKKVLEEKVTERTVELKGANDQLSVAFTDIKDSINYAKKIQEAILPLNKDIKKAFPHSFVLFKPRDVVSGDFYWFNKKNEKIYIAAVDCTGHGVPGAFMSMIGSSLLNEIVGKKGLNNAATVLKKLHKGIRKSLKQDTDSNESRDGMDLALAVVDFTDNTLEYSGAKRPLYLFRKKEEGYVFEEIKADKQSIGGLQLEEEFEFTNNVVNLQKGDTFYLFTDGFVDQFGGEKGKKFSSKRLRDTLTELQNLSLQEQGKKLSEIIEDWKKDVEQVDDILVIGVRF